MRAFCEECVGSASMIPYPFDLFFYIRENAEGGILTLQFTWCEREAGVGERGWCERERLV